MREVCFIDKEGEIGLRIVCNVQNFPGEETIDTFTFNEITEFIDNYIRKGYYKAFKKLYGIEYERGERNIQPGDLKR